MNRHARLLLACLLFVSTPLAAQQSDGAAASESHLYTQWDVFTDQPLSGNQLAVFTNAQSMTSRRMQDIAREMAFSESAFVVDDEIADADFRVRIFTPDRELPYAGHPTIGTAFALARSGAVAPGAEQVVFSEGIGPVTVQLEWDDGGLRFAWMDDTAPILGQTLKDVEQLAAALGITTADIVSTELPVKPVSAGGNFLIVPVATRAAVDRAVINPAAVGAIMDAAGIARQSVYLFSTEHDGDGADVYARKLGLNGREDPATGSAAGPLAGYLFALQPLAREYAKRLMIRQGVHMQRPSWLHVRLELDGDEIAGVQVGGTSVYVGNGKIVLPQH